MRLNELTFPSTRLDAHQVLMKAGYTWLGKGSWGRVYRKDHEPYVLKVFSANDNAYLAFLELARNHPNVHFPKIIGKLIRVTPQYYAVRLEPLEAVFISEQANWFIEVTNHYIKGIGMVDFSDTGSYWWSKILDARDYMEEHPDIKEACDLISTLLPRFNLDIELKNVMFRGKTLVLTDPLWDSKAN